MPRHVLTSVGLLRAAALASQNISEWSGWTRTRPLVCPYNLNTSIWVVHFSSDHSSYILPGLLMSFLARVWHFLTSFPSNGQTDRGQGERRPLPSYSSCSFKNSTAVHSDKHFFQGKAKKKKIVTTEHRDALNGLLNLLHICALFDLDQCLFTYCFQLVSFQCD